jgi:hypothetical protein
MRVKRRRTVRAHDPQVLQPVVVADAVDVIENEPHRPIPPDRALTAQLTDRRLEPEGIQALLQMVAAVRRTLDEDLLDRSWCAAQRASSRSIGIKVVGLDAPPDHPVLQRSPVGARRAELQSPQGLGEAE